MPWSRDRRRDTSGILLYKKSVSPCHFLISESLVHLYLAVPPVLSLVMHTPQIFLLTALILPLSISAHSSYQPKIDWVDCNMHVPNFPDSPLILEGVDLASLPSTLHCGQLIVSMDYSKPLCESNIITLGLAMYRPVNPKDVIF